MLDRNLCSFIVLFALVFVQFHYSLPRKSLDLCVSLVFLFIYGFMVLIVELLAHSYLCYVSNLGAYWLMVLDTQLLEAASLVLVACCRFKGWVQQQMLGLALLVFVLPVWSLDRLASFCLDF